MPKETKHKYLFQRGKVWWLRLQQPAPDKPIVKSLETKNKPVALSRAAPEIEKHERRMMERRASRYWEKRAEQQPRILEPGRHDMSDRMPGWTAIATADYVRYYDPDGNLFQSVRNRQPLAEGFEMILRRGTRMKLTPIQMEMAKRLIDKPRQRQSRDEAMIKELEEADPKARQVSLESYRLFREFCGRTLATATREDATAFLAHLHKAHTPATAKRMLAYLHRAAEYGMEKGKLKVRANPFRMVAPEVRTLTGPGRTVRSFAG